MLGIQNSLPAKPVKFGSNHSNYNMEQERDSKLKGVNDIRDEFESLADSLEGNGDKVSQKAGKIARGVATAVGIAGTFIMAKYGSRAAMNTIKNVAKSDIVMGAVKNVQKIEKPAKKVLEATAGLIEKTGVKESKVAKKALEIINKEPVQKAIKGVTSLASKGVKAVKSVNYQAAIENTLGASATASVIIDDLAGRNTDKSNIELAMGASGGDV